MSCNCSHISAIANGVGMRVRQIGQRGIYLKHLEDRWIHRHIFFCCLISLICNSITWRHSSHFLMSWQWWGHRWMYRSSDNKWQFLVNDVNMEIDFVTSRPLHLLNSNFHRKKKSKSKFMFCLDEWQCNWRLFIGFVARNSVPSAIVSDTNNVSRESLALCWWIVEAVSFVSEIVLCFNNEREHAKCASFHKWLSSKREHTLQHSRLFVPRFIRNAEHLANAFFSCFKF